MKHILLFLLLFCTTVFGSDRPKGFSGINWGASPEEAKRIMQSKSGVKFTEETDDYKFELTGGTFAGQAVTKWILEFPERKFASATVVLKAEGGASSLYKDFRTQFVEKYGPATTDKKLSAKADKPSPYPSGTTEKKSSLGGTTTWKFEPNIKEKNNVSIICKIADAKGAPATDESQLVLTIHYANETLSGTATKIGSSATKTSKGTVKKEDL